MRKSSPNDEKDFVVLHGDIQTPPMTGAARTEAGHFIRLLQQGNLLSLPHSRPMPIIGPNCHELRIDDENKTWRIIYRIDEDAIVVAEVFAKKTQVTPPAVIKNCRARLRFYDGN